MSQKVKAKWVGKVFPSLKWGDAVVLDCVGNKVLIKFLNTGHVSLIHRVALYQKTFADNKERLRIKNIEKKQKETERYDSLYRPTLSGVGYQGAGKYSYVKNPEFYRLWAHMIYRCYKGGKGLSHYEDCFVVDRWHNFQNFCEDIQKLPGFDKWVKFEKGEGGRNLYQLDKDTREEGNKIYCPDLCHFITHTENTVAALSGGRTTYQFVKDGEIITVYDLNKWCAEEGINPFNIRFMIAGGSKSSAGYVMYNPEVPLEDHPVPSERTAKKDITGTIFPTKRSGPCTVIEYVSSVEVYVQFPDTGSVKKTTVSSLNRGSVLDPEKKKSKLKNIIQYNTV